MLVLSRRLNEKLLFPGMHTSIQVVSIKPGVVRLGIQAPDEVRVLREEVPDRAANWGPAPDEEADPTYHSLLRINQLLNKRLEIARRGLCEAQLLAADQPEDASVLLEKVDEDLHMLQRRLRLEVEKAGPAREPGCLELDGDEELAFAGAAHRPR